MKPMQNLPKINKAVWIKDKKVQKIVKRSISADIQEHPLFIKRIKRLKDQKMKDLTEKYKTKIFINNDKNEASSFLTKSYKINELSPIKKNKNGKNLSNTVRKYDSEKLIINENYMKKLRNRIYQNKIKGSNSYIFNRDIKLNYSKYLYIKNDENFIKYMIHKFIDKKYIAPKNKKSRSIYAIMQGSIVITYNDIPGHFINIPISEEIKKIDAENRQKIFQHLLKKLTTIFGCKRNITSIFLPNKELILDLTDIKEEHKYIYLSQTIICKGISIVLSPIFINLYKKEYQGYINYKKIKNEKLKLFLNKKLKGKKKKNFKIERLTKGITAKREKLKNHYSFSSGENEIENIKYVYYSDNEEKKEEINKKIFDKCFLKNDFYLLTNESDVDKKLKLLKNSLNYKSSFKLKESYDKYKISFEKILNRFRNDIHKKYSLNPKNFNSMNSIKDNDNYDFQDLDGKYENLYLKKKGEKKKIINMPKHATFCNIDKKVNKQYSYFISYNIPKLLDKYKKYNRKKLFDIFIQFKDLIALSLSLNQNELILKNGLDFDTFMNCIFEIQDEEYDFAKNLFSHINKSDSPLLNIEDFIKGMYFIKNSDLTEKLELFSNSLDISNKKEINFQEAIKISKNSILKYLDEKYQNKYKDLILKELSEYLANFIFQLVGIKKNECINIERLKKFIKENRDNKNIRYLEMFYGVKK